MQCLQCYYNFFLTHSWERDIFNKLTCCFSQGEIRAVVLGNVFSKRTTRGCANILEKQSFTHLQSAVKLSRVALADRYDNKIVIDGVIGRPQSARWFKSSIHLVPKLERPLVSRGNNGPFTVVQLGVWPAVRFCINVPILIWIESTSTHANGHPRLALNSRESRNWRTFFFFCLASYFPARNPRPGMLGRDAARHGVWTLMERARAVLVIQREKVYPSHSAGPWKLESPKLLHPYTR